MLGGLAKERDEARVQLKKALDSGKAAEVFEKMVSGLGGPGDLVARPMEYLPVAEVRAEVPALSGGWVDRIDTRELGMAVVELGGGTKACRGWYRLCRWAQRALWNSGKTSKRVRLSVRSMREATMTRREPLLGFKKRFRFRRIKAAVSRWFMR